MNRIKTFQLWEGRKDPEKRKTGGYKYYPADEFLKLAEAVAAKIPEAEWGVPADIYGHASQYLKFEEAKKKIEEYTKYWEGRNDPAQFAVWNIDDSRLDYVNSTRKLAKGLESLAEFVEPDKTKRLSVTMNSKGIQDFGNAMSRGDYGSLD